MGEVQEKGQKIPFKDYPPQKSSQYTQVLQVNKQKIAFAETKEKAPEGFEPSISCLLDRRFNQLSHGAIHNYSA